MPQFMVEGLLGSRSRQADLFFVAAVKGRCLFLGMHDFAD